METIETIPSIPLREDQTQRCKEWIDSLRSGEHKQSFNSLIGKDESSFCCLGVACKISSMEMHNQKFDYNNEKYDMLPPKVWFDNYYGFNFHSVVARSFTGFYTLANLNDNVKLNFNQIADVIESVFITRTPIKININ